MLKTTQLIEVIDRTEEIQQILIQETIMYRRLLMLSLDYVPIDLQNAIKKATQI